MPLDKTLLKEESETVVKQSCVDEKSMFENEDNNCDIVYIADQRTPSSSKENDQVIADTSITIVYETTAHTGQETSQKSLKIESNDTNTVQNTPYPDNNRTSLNMIALAYNSDEEIDTNENKCEQTDKIENQSTPIDQTDILQQYRISEVLSSNDETDSENESSSSDTKSSSDSSDSDSDIKNKKENNKSNEVNTAKKLKEMKSEFDELPPIEDLQISVSEDLCHLFGEIVKIVEQMVVVKPQPDKPTLNLETVLFLDKGQRVLGKIFDVFGSVSEPYYCIRFNDFEHIKQHRIETGLLVYYCPDTEYTLLVFLHELTKIRGCDAVGDDEPPEFSDDEEEQAYYQKLNQKNDSADSAANSTPNNSIPDKRQRPSRKRKRGWQSNHPWNRNARESQRENEKQLFRRNNNRCNRKYYNDRQQEYAYQNNAYWQLGEQHLTSSRLHPDMSQYRGQSNFQIYHQYPRTRYNTPPRLLPNLMNYSQFSNAPLSRNMDPYSTHAPMSTHTITSWPSPSVTPSLISVPPPPGDSPPYSSSSLSFSKFSSSFTSSSSTKATTSNDCDTTPSN